MNSNKKGFTLIEMIFCISVILVILLLVIPNVTSKNRLVKEKSCDAQIEVVNSQIILYEIEHGELPTSMSQLTSGSHPYLKEKQVMVKPMFQNKGFTLIEMLLVISIILTLSVLSFPFMNTKTIYITDECVKKQIGMIINQAKSKAIISHEKVSLIVSKQEISFIDHQKKYRVVLPNNYFFNNIKEIYFNKDGNINQANHIDLIAPKKKYTLIFHLGAGDYEFK